MNTFEPQRQRGAAYINRKDRPALRLTEMRAARGPFPLFAGTWGKTTESVKQELQLHEHKPSDEQRAAFYAEAASIDKSPVAGTRAQWAAHSDALQVCIMLGDAEKATHHAKRLIETYDSDYQDSSPLEIALGVLLEHPQGTADPIELALAYGPRTVPAQVATKKAGDKA